MDTAIKLQLSIDKQNWIPVKFGDVVFEPKENTKDPINDGIQHVVGLEHIESNDVHLRKSSSLEGTTTFSKKFAVGDVLFGRRRAYLKKAALASFNGICSGDITVFRAKNELLLPALLPFIVHNEKFFDYAVKHSAGGLSPRVKFKDLANYEFLLPPKDQQAELAELLWSVNGQIEHSSEIVLQLKQYLNSKIEYEIHGMSLEGKSINTVLHEYSNHGELIRLDSCGQLLKGKSIPKSVVLKAGIPCIRYGELYTKHHRVIQDFYSFIDENEASKSIQLKVNDVLFAGSGETIKEIGKSAAFVSDQRAFAGGDILIFRPKKMDGTYLGYLMNSSLVRHQLNKLGSGATVMHIYNSDLAKVLIPKIDLSRQIEIGKKLQMISKSIDRADTQVENGRLLEKSIINQIF